jgi:ABC-type transporter MlaC component
MDVRALRHAFLAVLMVAASLTAQRVARADDDSAIAFVQSEHGRLMELLREAPKAARARQQALLQELLDHDELVRRAFGQPCPVMMADCTNHWASLKPAQRAEVTQLLTRLLENNVRKHLTDALDYDVRCKAARTVRGELRVRTETLAKRKPRDPPIQVDYVLVPGAERGKYRVVDVVTEGSSLTKNYYDQFHRMLTNASQGYPELVRKLKQRVAAT